MIFRKSYIDWYVHTVQVICESL